MKAEDWDPHDRQGRVRQEPASTACDTPGDREPDPGPKQWGRRREVVSRTAGQKYSSNACGRYFGCRGSEIATDKETA